MVVIARSQRLYLREVTLEDAEVFFRMDSDPMVMRHIGDGSIVTDPDVTRAALSRIIAAYPTRPGLGLWACCLLDGSACVGWLALKPCPLRFPDAAEGDGVEPTTPHIEIGYRLIPECWGRGYATEMTVTLLKHAFDGLGLERVVAACTPANAASSRVMVKAGLTYQGEGLYGATRCDVYAAARDRWAPPAPFSSTSSG